MSETIYKKIYEEGQLVGSLIFISRIPPAQKGGNPKGKFMCVCGKEFITRINAVEIGKTKSCGCFRPTMVRNPKKIYESGQIINNIIYVSDAPYKPNFPRKANLICHCGNKFITAISSIESKMTKSCGCSTSQFHKEKSGFPEKTIPNLTEEDKKRFWSKVAVTENDDKCWSWEATGKRYGSFSIKGSSFKSNRVTYFLSYNIDPKEFSVMHTCDNPKCCNPKHLSLGTHLENMQDMAKKGRAFKGEREGGLHKIK